MGQVLFEDKKRSLEKHISWCSITIEQCLYLLRLEEEDCAVAEIEVNEVLGLCEEISR
jgi:hypothetical protein